MLHLPPPYEYLRLIGRGGMASVHLARDPRRGSLVAVKTLEPDERGRFPSSALTQMREEAAMLGGLSHRAVPAFYELIETEAVKGLVMEYVDGHSLDGVEPLPDAVLLDYARQLCDVLAYLHGHAPPIIFRDLKPGNILVDQGGRLVLIDFGIAKYLDEKLRRSTQTTARGMLTRGFAAVEQYIGGTDARSDIYAFGATLYTLASGRTPPESMSLALGRATLDSLATVRPDLSPVLIDTIDAMMQTDRNLRPQGVEAVAATLGFDLAASPPARPPVVPVPIPRAVVPPPTDASGPPTERAGGDDGPAWFPPSG